MSKNAARLVLFPAVCFLVFLFVAEFGLKSQAAPAKKPAPEPIWGAQIADYGNLVGMGDNVIYGANDPYARVTVQKSTAGGGATRSTIHFFVYPSDPPQRWAQFQGLSLSEFTPGEPGPAGACGFPAGYTSGILPDCFLNFFNSLHPKLGYEQLLFYFVVDAYIEDPSLFPIGTPISWTGGGAVTVYLWNAFDPLSKDDPEPYESITASLKGLCTDYPKGYWITRLDDKTWEITIEQQVFNLAQFYDWESTSTGRNGKPVRTITYYQPLAGKGELSYKIRLIKNPS